MSVNTGTLIYSQRRRKNNVGNNKIDMRPKNVDKIISKHQKYFHIGDRKNKARSYVYEILSRYYRSIGDRKKAVINAKNQWNLEKKNQSHRFLAL